MEYRGLSLAEACRMVVHDKLAPLGGEGGLVAVDAAGNVALPFNSEGMYRASQTSRRATLPRSWPFTRTDFRTFQHPIYKEYQRRPKYGRCQRRESSQCF